MNARAALLVLLAVQPLLRSGVPEPDTILYGTVTLDGVPVAADGSDVVVEARRRIDGPAIAAYQMGSAPAAGDLYTLRLRMESEPPLLDAHAALAGEALFIVVADASGFRGQTAHTLSAPGLAERKDLSFGIVDIDVDQDGLPDAWESARLGGLGADMGTVMPNGQTAHQNYVAGTDPNDPSSVFEVIVTTDADQLRVSFLARRAEGAGYEGRTRLYTLESTADVGEGWQGVPGFVGLPGHQQLVECATPVTNPPAFFRGRVWLE